MLEFFNTYEQGQRISHVIDSTHIHASVKFDSMSSESGSNQLIIRQAQRTWLKISVRVHSACIQFELSRTMGVVVNNLRAVTLFVVALSVINVEASSLVRILQAF